MLGRPFGAPNEPDFQRRVLKMLLALFERRAGPVLEDFWHGTAAARVFLALREVCLSSADPSLRTLGETALVPRAITQALEGLRSSSPNDGRGSTDEPLTRSSSSSIQPS